MAELRKYEPLYSVNRDKKLAKVQEAYERFKETKTFEFPQWLYGAPIGKLIKVEVEDTARALEPIANALEAVRGTDIKDPHPRGP